MTEEDIRDLEQLSAPMILLGDFNAHNPLWGSKKMSTRGRMIEKILNRYNLLCIYKKEEIYYRAFDSRKSTIARYFNGAMNKNFGEVITSP